MATRCFERAEDTYGARLAKAHGLKAAAEQKRHLNPEAAHVDLRKAAEIFEEIGEARPAAKCFFQLNEYERAGKTILEYINLLTLFLVSFKFNSAIGSLCYGCLYRKIGKQGIFLFTH